MVYVKQLQEIMCAWINKIYRSMFNGYNDPYQLFLPNIFKADDDKVLKQLKQFKFQSNIMNTG